VPRLLAAALLAALAAVAVAAQPARPTLTVDLITQRPETWIGAWPGAPFWTDAGDAVVFPWNPRGAFEADSLFTVPAAGGAPRQLAPAERRALAPRFEGWHATPGAYDRAQARRAFERDGDLFVLDLRSGRETRLTETRARESEPRWMADGTLVYRAGTDLFRLDVTTGAVRQLTDLRAGRAPAEPKAADEAALLRDQQTRLFDVLRERARRDSLRTVHRDRDRAATPAPPTYYVGDQSVSDLTIDPEGRFVTFTLRTSAEAENTLLADYVTLSGVAEEISARPKVGGPTGRATLHVQDLLRDTTYAVDLTTLPGAFDAPDYKRAADPAATDSSRVLQPIRPAWSPGGRYAVVEVRTRDNKDRWITRLDPAAGTLTVLDRQRDEAWVGGPGISWWAGASDGGWLADGRTFWFQSERTGWSHLYAVNVESGAVTALTSGTFEVSDAVLGKDGRTFYFLSSEGDLGQRHVYRLRADAGTRERLTEGVGRWDFAVSPDEAHLALLHSRANRPPEVYVQRIGRAAQRVTESPTPEWLAYPWREAEIVEIPASDGARVPARIYRPEQPNGAAVLFVHGAGYLQNAHRWWSSYVREYQFHHLMADQGYLVLDLDFRASEGYGRDWRTAVYRHMGGRDLQDYVDASRYVGEVFGIAPERVAIYGGSYGGFLTLMALFTEPEHFGAGAALRSVTDWAHYNDAYTRNILNTPAEDPEAYRRSSPIEFAAGLQDPLLMTHGLVDDNVQPQDIFRLSQRLIELGKRDWELAIAPVEPHGYREPTSWADKLHRILALFDRTGGPARPGAGG
jgi:dipeptidyl aminopeptidase/acylaminoacyl peptidase